MSKKKVQGTKRIAETTETPVDDTIPPRPEFIEKWQDLLWGYDYIAEQLGVVLTNIPESDETPAIYCTLQALRLQNSQQNALFDSAWHWLHKPEIKKTFGIKRCDELIAENARKQAEQSVEHPIQ